jgi:hypothetical protein
MRKPKIWDLTKENPIVHNKYFIINEKQQTAIQVPKMVLGALDKVRENDILADVLATAIQKRRLMDISTFIEYWYKEGYHHYTYPQCRANAQLDKLMSSCFRNTSITKKEGEALIKFFAKCPHGYDVTNLIEPHSEFQAVIT